MMARTQWSPAGVDRFYQLVNVHYYDDASILSRRERLLSRNSGCLRTRRATRRGEFGGSPMSRCVKATGAARCRTRASGPGTRTVQLFINLKDNARLDTTNTFGFPAFAEVVSGMSVVDSLYQGYGDSAPRAPVQSAQRDTTRQTTTQRDTSTRVRLGPSQDSITLQGTPYLLRGWPKLDYIKTRASFGNGGRRDATCDDCRRDTFGGRERWRANAVDDCGRVRLRSVAAARADAVETGLFASIARIDGGTIAGDDAQNIARALGSTFIPTSSISS